MKIGLLGGLFWAVGTIFLGLASFGKDTNTLIIYAGLHDCFSAIFITGYVLWVNREFFLNKKNKSMIWIVVGAILGEPIGMIGYIMSMKYLGASYAAIISGTFPVLGCLFAFIFLKEKYTLSKFISLALCVIGIIIIGYGSGRENPTNITLGIIFGLVCCIGWALETVLCAVGMRDNGLTGIGAVFIRQTSASLFFVVLAFLLYTHVGKNGFNLNMKDVIFIIIASVMSTFSLCLYYVNIQKIGASRAMIFNISYCAWAVLIQWIAFGKKPLAATVISCIFIMAGAMINKDE